MIFLRKDFARTKMLKQAQKSTKKRLKASKAQIITKGHPSKSTKRK